MAARKFDQERLDKLVEAAKASERPYAALEGKPFNLSASVARTIVVGSGLSKSAPELRKRERERIKRWLSDEPAKQPKPRKKAAARPDPVEIPEAVAEAVTARHKRSTRKHAPSKTGEPSDTAKAIAASRSGRVRTH
jgi:hypothetical protein